MCAATISQPTRRQDLQDWLRLFRTESYVVREQPHLLFQQAANQPDSTAPARTANDRFAAGVETRPWIQWINKPLRTGPDCVILAGHSAGVWAGTFSPSGDKIASWAKSHDGLGELKIWNAEDGSELTSVRINCLGIPTSSLSHDTSLLALVDQYLEGGYLRHMIRVVNTETGADVFTIRNPDYEFKSCDISRDNKYIATGDAEGDIKIWDLTSGRERISIHADEHAISNCYLSPDAGRIVTTSPYGVVRLFDTESGATLHTLAEYETTAYAFSEDGQYVAAGQRSGHRKWVQIYDVNTGTQLWDASVTSTVSSCAFSPDNQYLAVGLNNGQLKILLTAAGTEIATLSGHASSISECGFSPNGKQIVSASGDGSLRVWPAPESQQLQMLEGHAAPVEACYYTNDGKQIISGDSALQVTFWDLKDGNKIAEHRIVAKQESNHLYSSDGAHLLTHSENEAQLWEVSTGTLLKTLAVKHQPTAFAVSPDGHVAIGFFGCVEIWADRRIVEVPGLVDRRIMVCVFSPDGRKLAVGSEDVVNGAFLKIFETSTWQQLQTLRPDPFWGELDVCVFSADSSLVAISGGRTYRIHVYDIDSGEVKAVIDPAGGGVTACAFSPSASHLVAALFNKTVRVWEVATGRETANFAGHLKSIQACRYSPDGLRIASASEDGTIRIWNPTAGRQGSEERAQLDGVSQVLFAPNNQTIAALRDNTSWLELIDAITGRQTRNANSSGPSHNLTDAEFSPDSKVVAATTDKNESFIADVTSGQTITTLTREGGVTSIASARACTFSPDCETVIVAQSEVGNAWANCVRALATSGQDVRYLWSGEAADKISRVQTSVDGVMVRAERNGGVNRSMSEMSIFDCALPAEIINIPLECPPSLGSETRFPSGARSCWNPDERRAAISVQWRSVYGSLVSTIVIFNTSTHKDVTTIELWNEAISDITYACNGKQLIAGTDRGKLYLIDSGSGQVLNHQKAHKSAITFLSPTTDGRMFVSGSSDGKVRIADVATGKQLAMFDARGPITSASVSPDGSRIAIGTKTGAVQLLTLKGLESEPPLATPVYLYHLAKNTWDDQPTARCAYCAERTSITSALVKEIERIGQAAGLVEEQSPCTVLPDVAWNEPSLVAACSACQRQLRFVPFVIDNRAFAKAKNKWLAEAVASRRETKRKSAEAARAEVGYLNDLREWKSLPRWKRLITRKPKLPKPQ